MIDDRRWYEKAECAKEDPAIFTGLKRWTNWRQARQVCARCPVTQECLEDAMKPDDLLGWQKGIKFAMFTAGHTPRELTDIYNDRKEAA